MKDLARDACVYRLSAIQNEIEKTKYHIAWNDPERSICEITEIINSLEFLKQSILLVIPNK